MPLPIIIKTTNQIRMMHTKIRDRTTPRYEFIFYADRLIRILIERVLELLPMSESVVETPTGSKYLGCMPASHICGVSIERSGGSMVQGLREVCQNVRIGKLLIQRNEETKLPFKIWRKYPEDIAERYVLLMDPMLATGGSACCAIEDLMSVGVPENRIIFANLIAAPEGIKAVIQKYPEVQIITTSIDDGLNTDAYILPGIGDFGDRYFGTA